MSYIFKRGKIWYIEFKVQGNRTKRSLKTERKREAIDEQTRIDYEIRAGLRNPIDGELYPTIEREHVVTSFPTILQALKDFIEFKTKYDWNPNVAKRNRDRFNLWLNSIENPEEPITALKTSDFQRFIDIQKAWNTKKNHLTNYKTFMRWLSNKYGLKFAPLKIPKRPPKNLDFMTRDQLQKMIDKNEELELKRIKANKVNPSQSFLSHNDIWLVLFYSAMRTNEIFQIQNKHVVDLKRIVLGRGIATKTNQERIIPIYSDYRDIIEKYLDKSCPNELLFKRKDIKRVSRRFREIREKVFPNENWTLYTLRSSGAHYLVNEKRLTLDELSKMLGHASVKTTQAHYASILPSTLEDKLE